MSTLSLAPSLKHYVDYGTFDNDSVEMGTAELVHVLPGTASAKDKGKGKAHGVRRTRSSPITFRIRVNEKRPTMTIA
jgi:hypothetical protein